MWDKYLKITQWLRKRYTKSGYLVVCKGYNLSLYSKLESLAYKKYILGE